MIGLRGKIKGQRLVMHQYCNDWISADTEDGKAIIVNLTSVKLESLEERERFGSYLNTGSFWHTYELNGDLRFVKRRHD